MDNPYRSPEVGDAAQSDEREVADGDIGFARRSLMSFGAIAFITPVLLAVVTDHLHCDILAVYFTAYASGITSDSFKRFPVLAVLLLLYPLAFVGQCFSANVLDFRTWVVPTRTAFSPLGFYLILAVWATVNSVLVVRLHRIQRDAEPPSAPQSEGE